MVDDHWSCSMAMNCRANRFLGIKKNHLSELLQLTQKFKSKSILNFRLLKYTIFSEMSNLIHF